MRTLTTLLGLALVGGLAGQENLQVTGGLEGMVDRYLTQIAAKYWEERAARVAKISTPGEVRARQEYIRRKVLEALGGFPEKTPLNARVTGTLEREGYRIEKLIYESQPRYYVTANLYVPMRGQPPYPAVLGTAGHSANGKAMESYQRVWISLARRGLVVLAYDPPGQGERYEYFDVEKGKPRFGSTTEHTTAGLQCLLTGTNFARWELWDGIRGYDYLLTRKEVDRKRIGVAGNSGGGTQTAYLMVVEPRLAAATPACYLTSWEKLWDTAGPQDAEQNFAGFLKDGLNFGDFLIAFAPKPVKMETATQDFFPIEGAKATFAEAQRIYQVLGAADRIGFFEYNDKHGWSRPLRQATYQWMQQWLNGVKEEGLEEDFKTEPDANLNATPTGQLATSLKGETVQSLNQALAERIYRPGRIKDPAKLRAAITARLGLPSRTGLQPVTLKVTGMLTRPGYRIHKLAFETEPGITVPALLFAAEEGSSKQPAVLYLNPAGKAADAEPGGAIEALVKSGHLVLAADLRGWGESGLPKKPGVYGGSYQTAMRAILLGKTLVGMQVYDALRLFDHLAAGSQVDAARITVVGKGHGGVVALFAAALEPRIARATLEGTVSSYMGIVRAKLHENTIEIVVPGVLREFDLPDLEAALGPRVVRSGR